MAAFPTLAIEGLHTPLALTQHRSGRTGLNDRHLPQLLAPEMMPSVSSEFSVSFSIYKAKSLTKFL